MYRHAMRQGNSINQRILILIKIYVYMEQNEFHVQQFCTQLFSEFHNENRLYTCYNFSLLSLHYTGEIFPSIFQRNIAIVQDTTIPFLKETSTFNY